jgi:hypothetical protein
MRAVVAGVAFLIVAGTILPEDVRAQSNPPATPTPQPGGTATPRAVLAQPERTPPDLTPRSVRVPVTRSAVRKPSPETASLLRIKAIAVGNKEARVLVDGIARILRVGDSLGTDTVKDIGENLLVLVRAESAGRANGDGSIVVRFDALGQPEVRAYWTRDSTARVPPEVQ